MDESTNLERLIYPESDGQPMGETPLHIGVIMDSISCLSYRYRDRSDVYVGGDMFFYYEEGNPSASLCPDVFVALGVPKKKRRIYRLWEEPRMPQFVIEVTSKRTRVEDEGNKKGLYLRLGVEEYFLFDPDGDYLSPRLQGFRRHGSELRPMRLGPGGALESRVLGLNLVAEGERLRFIEAGTGVKLRFYDELGADAERLAERLRELGVDPEEIT